jgi:LmbE family N-acetylglucosaminyl deacetylase
VHRDFLRLGDEDAWARGVLVFAAHPDDETIGAGGVMPHLPVAAVVHVTDGAPADRRWWGDPSLASREVYAGVRRAELACALALAGIGADRMRSLGREDQRVSLDMAALAEELAWLIHELRPGVVLTHPYEGGHPDHDATAFAVHAAREMVEEPPLLIEFTSYHASSDGIAVGEFLPPMTSGSSTAWDAPASPRRADAVEGVREGGLRAVVDANSIRPAASGTPNIPAILEIPTTRAPVSIALTPDDRERKAAMLACFATQAETLAQFPVAVCEWFRIAPAYDFTRPPHPGTLWYERFDWGTTGSEWRACAAEALDALGVWAGAAR